MAAAELLSRWESSDELDFLYNAMHGDSMTVVPRYAVNHWYRTVFLPSGPQPAISTGVRYLDWTWGVNGVTYPGTAEVSFIQSFADGTVIDDVVRLVFQDDRWRWFFGRSQEFVEEQIQLGRSDVYPSDVGQQPEWADALGDVDSDALGDLPARAGGGEITARDPEIVPAAGRFPSATEQVTVRYLDQGYDVASATWIRVDGFAVDFITAQLDTLARFPAFLVTEADLLFRSDRPFAWVEAAISDAVGTEILFFMAGNDRSVWLLRGRTTGVIDLLAAALANASARTTESTAKARTMR